MEVTSVPVGSQLINIATAEIPILVSEAVVSRDGSNQEREWWDALASGSVVLPDEVLNKLLSPESTDAKKGK